MTSARRRVKGRKGEYLVLAKVAQGSLTNIHLASLKGAEGVGRFYVFRELLPHLSKQKESVNEFLGEARIAHRFDHPNLVRVEEVIKSKGRYHSISPFLLGDGLGFLLASVLKGGDQLPIALAVGLVAQACEGIGFVHQLRDKHGEPLGLVHKNVNLRNLVVLSDGRVKVVNFDLLRPQNRPHPSRQTAYLSPEQCVGKPLDLRSDVFSLGVVLWELLAGRRLFHRDDDMETRRAIMACQIPPLGDCRPEVTSDLQDIVTWALQKDPNERFKSAVEMGRALRELEEKSALPAGAQAIGEFVTGALADRLQAKQRMLEELEASEQAEADAALLLPAASGDLPGLAGEDPHGFDREPVTHVDRDKQKKAAPEKRASPAPPSLPPPPVETAGSEEEPVAEEEPAAEAEPAPGEDEVTPAPFEPSIRVRPSRRNLILPAGVAGGVLLILLIFLFVWPPGDGRDDQREETPEDSDAEVDAFPTRPSPDAVPEHAGRDPGYSGLASLEIVSDPVGCAVLLDNLRLQGRTPLANVIIPAGREYHLVVKCKGYRKESRSVVARPGQRLKIEFYPQSGKER